jgi:hypothetical protein
MAEFVEYQHIKLTLADVLAQLDELGVSYTRQLLRVSADETGESLKHQLGMIQGINKAQNILKQVFGTDALA